jgi:hypothetical protein
VLRAILWRASAALAALFAVRLILALVHGALGRALRDEGLPALRHGTGAVRYRSRYRRRRVPSDLG